MNWKSLMVQKRSTVYPCCPPLTQTTRQTSSAELLLTFSSFWMSSIRFHDLHVFKCACLRIACTGWCSSSNFQHRDCTPLRHCQFKWARFCNKFQYGSKSLSTLLTSDNIADIGHHTCCSWPLWHHWDIYLNCQKRVKLLICSGSLHHTQAIVIYVQSLRTTNSTSSALTGYLSLGYQSYILVSPNSWQIHYFHH